MPCGRPSERVATIDGRRITYELHRSPRRRKNVTLSVEGELLRVLSPVRASQRLIDEFIQQRADWITKRLAAEHPAGLQAELREGGSLPLLGGRYPIVASHVPFDFDGQRFQVDVERPDRAAFAEGWLREYARGHFATRVEYWSPIVGVQPARIQMRNQKTRWGSASSSGTLSFNWRLILAHPDIVDYVVVHELCHFIQPNHSRAYWQLVESILPDYKERRQALKDASDGLNW